MLFYGREKVRIKTINKKQKHSLTTRWSLWKFRRIKSTKKRRVLIVFDDTITDIESNEKSPIVTKLLLKGRKPNISLVFMSQSYFKVPKNIKLNATYYFVMKIFNKREFQQIGSNLCLTLILKIGWNYKYHTQEPYSFLLNDTTLSSDNPLQFKKNLL